MSMASRKNRKLSCAIVELEGVRYAIIRENLLRSLCRRCGVTIAGSEETERGAAGWTNIESIDNEQFARRLITRRKSAGLSQAALAREAGVRIETLNRIERGRTTPDFSTVRKLVVAIRNAEARTGGQPGAGRSAERRTRTCQ